MPIDAFNFYHLFDSADTDIFVQLNDSAYELIMMIFEQKFWNKRYRFLPHRKVIRFATNKKFKLKGLN